MVLLLGLIFSINNMTVFLKSISGPYSTRGRPDRERVSRVSERRKHTPNKAHASLSQGQGSVKPTYKYHMKLARLPRFRLLPPALSRGALLAADVESTASPVVGGLSASLVFAMMLLLPVSTIEGTQFQAEASTPR